MKKYFILLILFFFLSLFPKKIHASEINRYVNIVNPVRSRNFWESLDSVKKQIDLTAEYKLPVTWLLQYDAIVDDNNISLFKNLSPNQEIGVLLEVSEKLATDANVAYFFGSGDWARPDKVLFSGYPPDGRKRMIDRIFAQFKKQFGYYPSSVGAWYIDTLSLNYMVEKYHIQAVMYVADQYQTDGYGLWGQSWGAPYYPSWFNPLIAANAMVDKLDVVKIQWAQRDPVRGYGLTVADSIYSVQANDYIKNNLDINYFKKLAQIYLNSTNPIAQLTVGLEVGQEGAAFLDEFRQQLQFLIDLEKDGKISFQTMSSFAKIFKEQFPKSSPNFFIQGTDFGNPSIDAYWYSNEFYRVGLIKQDTNLFIRDLRVYDHPFVYNDVFSSDTTQTLKRIVPAVIDDAVDHNRRLLLSNIKQIQIDRRGEGIYFLVTDTENIVHEISLIKNVIMLNNNKLFENSPTKNYFDQIVAKIMILYWLDYPSDWSGSWRFSVLNNKYYFGYMVTPTKLVGIKSEFPFIGIFNFPFQVLVRFKTFPQINIAKLISVNLVNRINHSTIKVTTN